MPRDKAEPDRTGFVRPDAEHEVYWELYGPGGRQAVCLLNGLAMHTGSWSSMIPHLIDDFDVVLYDYLGQGRSTSRDEAVLIPDLGDHLVLILDELGIERLHVLGISYGGFVALDFARRHQDRLRTLTLSGILLSHEVLFQMYQDLSLRFYRAGEAGFALYTPYMYEKIFGESFVRSAEPYLEKMRLAFHERYQDRVHSLIRLTEAQNPFFGELDANLPGYRAIATPTLILTGAEDRVISPAVQRKIADVIPNTRFELIQGSGHVVYLEQTETFFSLLRPFLETGRLDFDQEP